MAVRFHELPLDAFGDKARPYIARLNRELRELFALEGTLGNPIKGSHSDRTIARREEPQVAISRITPSVGSAATEDPAVSDSVIAASKLTPDNRLIRSDGVERQVQVGAITLDDSGNLRPVATGSQGLGSSSLRFGDAYMGNAYATVLGTTWLILGSSSITSTVPSGVANTAWTFHDGITSRTLGNLIKVENYAGAVAFLINAVGQLLAGNGMIYLQMSAGGLKWGVNATGGGNPTAAISDNAPYVGGLGLSAKGGAFSPICLWWHNSSYDSLYAGSRYWYFTEDGSAQIWDAAQMSFGIDGATGVVSILDASAAAGETVSLAPSSSVPLTASRTLSVDVQDDDRILSLGANLTVPSGNAYTVTNAATDRTYNANLTTIDELADVLGTVISDLQTAGVLR